MRSPENVLESLKSKACNKSYKYERLYRNLYNPQFYLLAYQRIQAKPGNMTAGTDGKTIDGMGKLQVSMNRLMTTLQNLFQWFFSDGELLPSYGEAGKRFHLIL